MSGQSWRARRLAAQLGDRDLAVLASLREFRLMTGGQLRRLHFPGNQLVTQARKARAALRRLTELQVVVRLDRRPRRVGGLRAGSDSYLYGLSGWGHAVCDLGRDQARKHRRVTTGKPAFQEHTLAVAELAVALHERQRAGVCSIEECRAEPGCWRWFGGLGGGRRVLKPDAFLRLAVDDFELAAFIEVDQDTESLPTIARKCAVYLDYWRTGQEQHARGVFPLVWWLVPSPKRLRDIATVAARLPSEARALFTVALTTEATELLTRLPAEGGAR
jgi:hypothetical protein